MIARRSPQGASQYGRDRERKQQRAKGHPRTLRRADCIARRLFGRQPSLLEPAVARARPDHVPASHRPYETAAGTIAPANGCRLPTPPAENGTAEIGSESIAFGLFAASPDMCGQKFGQKLSRPSIPHKEKASRLQGFLSSGGGI